LVNKSTIGTCPQTHQVRDQLYRLSLVIRSVRFVEKMKLMQCKQGASSTSSDHTKGIGIVQLLRGKNFLITGATGFLVKGDSFSES
jgi:hypothetical protein